MPIYEYECTQCGHLEEVMQKISDPPVNECPRCHGKMKKLMSMNTFHLKGSGWYVTDYASKRNASSSAGSTSQSADTPGGTKTDNTGSSSESKTSSGTDKKPKGKQEGS